MSTCDNLNITVHVTSDEAELALSISRYVFTIIGILANLTVIIVFINCKIYRKCFTYILILQQSFIDLIACLLHLVLFNYPVPDGESGVVYCKCRTIYWVFASCSTYNLVYIAIERYIAVVHPLRYWARGELKASMLPQLCLPLLLSTVIVFHLAIFTTPDELSPGKCTYCHSSDTVALISWGSVFLLNWIVPMSIMVFCYRRVYVTMQNRPKKLSSTPYSKAQTKFIMTMVITTLVFVLTLTPGIILRVVYAVCDCFDYDRHPVREAASIFFVLSLAANPFVYVFKFNEFKSGFRKTFIRHGKLRKHLGTIRLDDLII